MGGNPQPKDPQTYADSNLIKQTINGTKAPVRTYIPSPDCQIRNMAPTRSYIPSSQGMVQEQYIYTKSRCSCLYDGDSSDQERRIAVSHFGF
jgi:hypothetical protein